MDKAVMFDFGGTLDTNGVHWSVKFQETYKKFGLEFTNEQYNYAYVKADEELKKLSSSINDYKTLLHSQTELHLKYIYPEKSDLEKLVDKITDDIMSDVNVCLAESKKIFDVLKKNKYKLCIVSNFYGNLDKVCKGIGFDKYMDAMLDSEVVGIEKPDTEIFSFALQKLSVSPKDTFVVGDSYERDIIPPKALGCRTIWLKNKSFKDSDNTDSADFIVNKLGDILRYLT
jgi:putative hydrolase of the HAD superfamily